MPCMELFEAQPQELPRRGAPAATCARGWRSSRREHELVEVGGHRRRRARPRPLRRVGAGYYGVGEVGLQRREHPRPRAGPCSNRDTDRRPMSSDSLAPATAFRPRPERVGRLPLARLDPRRAPAGADRRLRGRRRHLQPDDLPEGDERGQRLRRAAARAAGRRSRPGRASGQLLLGARRARHPGRLRRLPSGLGAQRPARRVCLARGRPAARLRHAADLPRGDAPARDRRPPEPDGEDPRRRSRGSRRSRT